MVSSLAPDIEIGVISQDTFLDPPKRDNTLNLSLTGAITPFTDLGIALVLPLELGLTKEVMSPKTLKGLPESP